ncbi:kanadaptin isoform X1 [Antechinus flavipes]|uniref:kanadaptin isoform X1 n=1 Tax=Antechinus flavipes TaxID=38775 RepID=UPI002236993F|nr:kanadaptin isoform X1 [Antechinus flavipes]
MAELSSEAELGSRSEPPEDDFKKPVLPLLSGPGEHAPGPASREREKRKEEKKEPPPAGGLGEQGARPVRRRDVEEEPGPGPPAEGKPRQSRAATGAPPVGSPAPAPPYKEPEWGGPPDAPYSLETLKGGTILNNRSLEGQSRCVFGRLPSCDVVLEHPSVSRFHAVLQHRARDPAGEEDPSGPGFYLYDLGSTHGTFLNKTRVPPRTYCRVRVGHVLRFGGSTRLFILQGPEDDKEAESELTVTQLKALRKQQQMKLEKKMLGEDSDEEEETDATEETRNTSSQDIEMGCTWGMGEDAIEDEVEENPIVIEFQQEREAFYIKDPKKALQGFFEREGEELEYEYDEQGHSTWLCRVRLPVDDSSGKQLVAEAIHSGKKKEAMIQCSLEACRMLDALGLLRQEAVSRKRKAKNWEDEDYYDSDDDTFLDRTGLVEKKRLNRMKKAGKIDDKPETYDSLIGKLNNAEKELAEISEKLKVSGKTLSESTPQDSLDAFMTEIKSGSTLDGVSRKKLHLRTFELRKEQQRLKGLIKLVKPTEMPELKKTENQAENVENKPKKLTLPLFGAMKGGSKFKLKTGTVGKLPPKRPALPPSLIRMKDEPEEEEEEEEEEEYKEEIGSLDHASLKIEMQSEEALQEICPTPNLSNQNKLIDTRHETESSGQPSQEGPNRRCPESEREAPAQGESSESKNSCKQSKEVLKKAAGPSGQIPQILSSKYPEDDPDYCVWVPPEGQSGDGRTHLNEKYGY